MTQSDPSCQLMPSLGRLHLYNMRQQLSTSQTEEGKRTLPHLGQGLVSLLRGAAVSLSDITKWEGHVLQGEVAIWWRERIKKIINIKLEELCS